MQNAEAAWFETGEAKDEKEYEPRSVDCTVTEYILLRYGAQVGVSATPPSISLGVGFTYEERCVSGKKTICSNGKEFADCSDIVGLIDSILGEGDCVANN